MKVLFTGVGSIGSRHIKNLSAICEQRGIELTIDVIRKSHRILPDDIDSKIRYQIWDDKGLDSHYDVLFITDETSTHYTNIVKFCNICDSMFIEKPIFDKTNYDEVKLNELEKSHTCYVAAPMRFSRYYEQMKQEVESNKVYSARIIFSSYMPSWQPGRDYTKSFRCFNDRGGGVDIDLLHEVDYMVSLFDFPKQVHRVVGKFSHLQMDACDMAAYIFEYPDKLVELHLDYFGRKRTRKMELFTEQDNIVIDFNAASVEYMEAKKVAEQYTECDFYREEMAYFLDLLAGKVVNINPPTLAYKVLKLTKGII